MKNPIDVYRSFELFCDGGYNIEPLSSANTYQMGVTKLHYDEETDTLHVHVRRPGLFIGKAGSNYDALKEYIDCDIKIHEVRKLYDISIKQSMTTKVNVHLVPTDEATWPNCIWLGRTSKQLNLDTSYNSNPKSLDPIDNSMLPQHLYFTLPQSNLEISKIKVGDWYIVDTNTVSQAIASGVDYWRARLGYEKVIATTDNFLGEPEKYISSGGHQQLSVHWREWKKTKLPSIPQSFIQHYITEYNKGNMIRSVEIELNTLNKDYNKVEDAPYQEIEILKLTSNNEVIVAPIENRMYNKDEIKKLLTNALMKSLDEKL